MAQLDSRHATQVNVQQQTPRLVRVRVIKKGFGAVEYLNMMPVCVEQTLDRSEHAGIIVNDKYCWLW